MQAKLFLIVNGAIVIALVFRLFLAKKPSLPTPLNFKKNLPVDLRDFFTPATKPKSINCPFDFNGKTLDAFEVLGVPAGDSKEACYRAYIDLKRSKPSVEIEAAWVALQSHFK